MKLKLMPERPLTARKIAVHMAALMVLVLLVIMAQQWTPPRASAELSDLVHTRDVRKKVLASCANPTECLGGFIVWKSGKIDLIDNCNASCGPYRIDVMDARNLGTFGPAERVHHVVLHMDDEWSDTLTEWALYAVRQQR